MKQQHKAKTYTLRTVFIIAFFFFSPALFAQNEIPIENGEEYNAIKVKPFLDTLHKQNDYVIAFRVVLPSSRGSKPNYFILTHRGQSFQGFKYTGELEKLILPDQSLELIWKNLVQNELFSMKDEKELSNFCPKKYHVYNSYSYEFTLISKSRIKTLSYYYPEHYDEACFGMPERKKIINSVSVIDLLALKD
ncbi:hypothetical protein [Daejeonella rubra]|uniref:hypothetical protein n=1 Tax=Daejeonella rubra TaxID=990371 RepID=UPI000B8792B1|nr:hypothetical protein [Daejeonella rubra]